jgi:hypothetical protein
MASELLIHGVELTQSIQYYRSAEHLTDPADQKPDNSIRLISGKALWVRVYVRSSDAAGVPDVSGTLELKRRALGSIYTDIATIDPATSVFAPHDANYHVERSTSFSTLNFQVSGELVCGQLSFTVKLQSPTTSPGEKTIYADASLEHRCTFTVKTNDGSVSRSVEFTTRAAPGQG